MATVRLRPAHQRILQPFTQRRQTLDWLLSRALVVPAVARLLPPPTNKRSRENDGGGPAKQPKMDKRAAVLAMLGWEDKLTDF